MANIVKKIGLLTPSSKVLLPLLETHFEKSSYHFCEINFDLKYLKGNSEDSKDTPKGTICC